MNRIVALLAGCILAIGLLSIGVTQEVPIGSLSGMVTMEENGRAMPHALVVVSPTRADDDYDWTPINWHARTDARGRFAIKSIPAGEYNIEVIAREHSLKDSTFTVTEGRASQADIRLTPNSFHLQLYASQTVLAPRALTHLDLHGFVGDSAVTFELRKLKLSEVARERGVSNLLNPLQGDQANMNDRRLDKLSQPVSKRLLSIRDRDIEGAFENKVELPQLDEGLYLAICKAGAQATAVFLNVSKIAMIAKTDRRGVHCLVTDIDTGEPIANAQLLEASSGRFQRVGKTGTDGLGLIAARGSEGEGAVMARFGKSFAIAGFTVRSTAPDDSGDEETPRNPNTRIFTYADRPIYRPGDIVQFKAIVRRLQGEELKLPAPGAAKIEIYDPDENLLQVQRLPISSHGSVHGNFKTLAEAVPGVYRIEVHADGGVDRYYANLAAYRKPDYSITVTPAKPRYCVGDTASAQVNVQYFFGGPVVGAKIDATVYRSPVWDSDEQEEDSGASMDEQTDPDEFVGGEEVRGISALTDGLGHATISFPTSPESSDDVSADGAQTLYDYRYTVQVSVEEEGGQSFEGNGSLFVSRGNVRLTATTDPCIAAPGQNANLLIKTTSEDKPDQPAPGRPVHIEISENTWTRHTEVNEKLQTLDLATGSDGALAVPLKIGRSNMLHFDVSTTDLQGHKISEETDLYVEGGEDSEWDQNLQFKVRVDRLKYKVGDQVKAVIFSKSPGGVAFLTVQADDIKMTRLVPLTTGSTVVTFPLTRSMAPNAFIHAAYVHNRQYWEAEREIAVDRPDRRLEVSVQPDVPKALPGALVGFLVRTRDQAGRGVPAEVSLGVVDESIYAIKRDTTNIAAGMFPKRMDAVETTYSFPEIYLDGGDKGGGSVPVRRKFLDTASWNPVVETNGSGKARVTVRLPDNLTSWRATAVAATDDSQVGMATANVRASKPLMVRIEAPPFMVARDRRQVAVAVTNDSGADCGVNLSFDPKNLVLANGESQKLKLSNGQTSSVLLDLTANGSGQASLIATAHSNRGDADAMEAKWPVNPHGRLVLSQGSGLAAGNTEIHLDALPNRDPNTGSVVVTLSPSVMSGMIQSLDSLVQFPYGCVEQTMSRFLPAVLVTHAIKGTRIDRPDLQAKAVSVAADGFARLEKMQHTDGAFGWWTWDESDPFMTAWVLDGLKRAAAAGYPTPKTLAVHRALGWAIARLKSPFKDDTLRSRIFLAYAVSEYGDQKPAREALERLNLAKAEPGDLALAALAANACRAASIRDESMSRMLDALNRGPSAGSPWWFWDTDEYRSLTLLTLEEIRPGDPHIPELVKRLTDHRGCDGWETTRESSLAIAALCEYLEKNPDSYSASSVEIGLNGLILKKVNVDPATPDSPDLRLEIPITRLRAGQNAIRISATGGKPAYAYELRQYDVEANMPSVLAGKDLQVNRSYYRLEPHLMPDGTQKLLPSDKPISEARTGDIIRCEITVSSSRPIEYLMVEDPIPSNMRVTDREDPGENGQWTFWWSSLVIRDDRVSLFARWMPAGRNVLSYLMRAEGEGTSCALPTRASLMYHPDVYASGDSLEFEVKR